MGVTILDYAKEYGIGISQFVSVGNKPDVSGNDLIQYWADDERTGVILMYLENFGNPAQVHAAGAGDHETEADHRRQIRPHRSPGRAPRRRTRARWRGRTRPRTRCCASAA